jgi:hypothetical protein
VPTRHTQLPHDGYHETVGNPETPHKYRDRCLSLGTRDPELKHHRYWHSLLDYRITAGNALPGSAPDMRIIAIYSQQTTVQIVSEHRQNISNGEKYKIKKYTNDNN